MSLNKKDSKFGLASALALGLVLSFALASVAQAQIRYSLSGNTRAQIGNGLPLPITFVLPPNGAVKIATDAYIFQTTGPDPRAMTLIQGTEPAFLTTMRTIPVFLANKNVFQVRTSFDARGPANMGPQATQPNGTFMTTMGGSAISDLGTAMFAAGGRTGPAVVSWCPGFPAPGTATNPGCVNAQLGNPMKGRLVYTATGNQFGGTSRARLQAGGTKGGASVVLRGGFSAAPCKNPVLGGPGANANCFGVFSPVVLSTTLMTSLGGTFMTPGMPIAGGSFGLSGFASGMAGKIFPINVAASGMVLSVGPTQMGSFPANNVTDWAGPVTTGMITVQAPSAANGAENFILQGFDKRISGVGDISLVGASLSARTLSGDNANRAWANYTVGFLTGASVPSISNGGLILLSLLMVAATAWMLRRAVVTHS